MFTCSGVFSECAICCFNFSKQLAQLAAGIWRVGWWTGHSGLSTICRPQIRIPVSDRCYFLELFYKRLFSRIALVACAVHKLFIITVTQTDRSDEFIFNQPYFKTHRGFSKESRMRSGPCVPPMNYIQIGLGATHATYPWPVSAVQRENCIVEEFSQERC